MSGKPTFHMGQDWVSLLELGPAARTVLDLMHCNALFGRGGVVTHTVHVTSSWFTEMTAHWKKPMSGPTARRGMSELIERGVLVRLNDPNDGAGFVVRFVSDPGPEYGGPVNGFEHAKGVSSRCGLKAVYERRDEDGLLPADMRQAPKVTAAGSTGDLAKELDGEWDAPDWNPDDEEPEFDMSGFDTSQPGTSSLTPNQQEFAAVLEQTTAKSVEPRLRLLQGQCERIAEALHSALEQGWDPGELALRLASELNPKINMPEKFLIRKAADIGAPPVKANASTSGDKVMIKGKMVDLGSYDMGFGHTDPPAPQGVLGESEKAPAPDVEGKEERLRRIVLRARQRENG